MAFHHVSVTVSNFELSKAFYTKVLGYLGAQPAMEITGAPHPDPEGRFMLFAGDGLMMGIWEAKKEHRHRGHQFYAPGFHHLAFTVGSRAEVDALHQKLAADGAKILDAPCEYPYMPGYYAVYFTDPDGLKLECVHIPG